MDNRAGRRIPSRLEASLVVEGRQYPVYIEDISENGLHLIVSPHHNPKSLDGQVVVDIMIHLPDSPDVNVRGRVLWSVSFLDHRTTRKVGVTLLDPPQAFHELHRRLSYNERNEVSFSPIAVVGLSCYYPGAGDVKRLWENILARRREFRRIPDVRLPLADYYDPDPSVPDKTYATRAAVIDGFEFDWIGRGIPRSVVESSDISHWLALETALRALEDAGYGPSKVPPDRSGVVLGNTLTGEYSRAEGMRLRWPFVNRSLQAAAKNMGLSAEETAALSENMEAYYKSVFTPVTEDTLAGNLSNTIAGRICNFLNLNGGGYTVDGACSSSLIAVATAATSLSQGRMDLAIVGGVDVSLDTFELIGFAKTKALTRDDMRVYDRRASGFIPGEGAGFVVLKRLEDARATGDYVYAVLRGWAISSDGRGGITAPKAEAQALAIRRAYTGSGYRTRDLDFIEGHGTGTPTGDVAELTGISQAMGAPGEEELRSCGITSLKSIIGHTKAASGIGGFIKAVMAVNRRVIPPTANCSDPNPVFTQKARMLYPVMQGATRDRQDTLRAGVSGMGFGGINCHVTLESGDAPSARLEPKLEERKLMVSAQETELFVFGAATVADLKERLKETRRHATGLSVSELVDLAAHLSLEVEPSPPVRAALICDSPEALLEALQELEGRLADNPPTAGEHYIDPAGRLFCSHGAETCRTGFLFPGQGSQQLGMARILIERHEWARELAERVSGWLEESNGNDLARRVYRSLDRVRDDELRRVWEQELAATETAQPAICLADLLWLKALLRLGIEPVAVGGHSLGELPAFHAAGAFDEKALMRLAALRGRAMAAGADEGGTMASLACSREEAGEILSGIDGYAIVANINGPRQIVISGEKEGVVQAVAAAKGRGIATRPLKVSNAFHSRLVAGAAALLREKAPLPQNAGRLSAKLFTGSGGRQVGEGLSLHDHFAEQVVSQVDFLGMLQALAGECDLLIEVGPGRVLTGLAGEITGASGPPCLPVESRPGKDRDLNTVIATYFIRGGAVRWPTLYESRLVRPFVPPSDRIFIVNPCERPLEPELPGSVPAPRASSNLAGVAEATGIRPQVLSEYLSRRGSFLGSVIRADLENLPAVEAGTREAAAEKPKARESTMPKLPEEAAPAAEGESEAGRDSTGVVFELIEKRTGFPRESLSTEQRLLDDLNLDSIKSAELLAEAATTLGVSGDMDPAQFANGTIAEVAAALDQIVTEKGGAPAASAEEAWVRNFTVTFTPEKLPEADPVQSGEQQLESVLILAREEEDDLADSLRRLYTGLGARVRTLRFEEADEAAPAAGGRALTVGILPRTSPAAPASVEDLEQTIARLRAVVMQSPRARGDGTAGATVFVQFGGGTFGRDPRVFGIEQHCACALAASLHLERNDLKVRVLDFDPRIDADRLARAVVAECAAEKDFVAAGYDAERIRRVPYMAVSEPSDMKPRDITWSTADVVLVTGGAKGITAACALAFARETGVRMALVGSSPPEGGTADGRNGEIAATLERFREAGIEVRYYQCDIVDAAAVRELIEAVRKDLGAVTGVIHGAAVNIPRNLETVSIEEARKEVAPKILGAVNLCGALGATPPKLFVGFTSIIGVTGMGRNGWYGFSNEALDLLLRRFGAEHPETAVQCMAFSIWDEIGMGVRLGSTTYLAQRGISAIPPAEGVRRFLDLALRDPGDEQVIVTARIARLDTCKPAPHPLPRASRYLEKIVFSFPDVEVVARAQLSLAKDGYVRDHNWRGTYLFPTVFGLEAMGQAAAYATGHARFSSYRIEDITLERPIPVHPEGGAEIEVRAEVLEREPGATGRRVRTSIGTGQTGFSVAHFAATFVLGAEEERPVKEIPLSERPLGINPKQDLYNSRLLFQGPPYQRISEIFKLDSSTCIFRSRRSAKQEEKCREEVPVGPWLLGDPYFRDSLLHAVQLPVSQHICLPFNIGSITHHREKGEGAEALTGMVEVEECTPREVRAAVTVTDEEGQVIESLSGYVLKVLEHHEDYPTAEEIARPGRRDETIIRRELARRCGSMGFDEPAVSVEYAPGIHRLRKAERRRLIVPFLQGMARRIESLDSEVTVSWLETGKPTLEGAPPGFDISLSHDHGTVFCTIGKGPQGIDIELMAHRSEDEWIGILSNQSAPLLQELVSAGDSLDRSGLRIWTAREAFFKASGYAATRLRVKRREGEAVLFLADGTEGHESILTIPVTLTRGPERMLAIALRPSTVKQRPREARPTAVLADKLAFDRESYKVEIEEGARGEPVFVFRFPVTFREAANPSRTLYFTQYFDWIGKLREYLVQPLYEQLVEKFSSGKWGMVTNHAETTIIGEAVSGDTIEGRIRLGSITGKEQSTPEFHFEWRRRTADGASETIAFSRMSTTWVAVRGHGVVEVQPLPKFGRDYLEKLLPPTGTAGKPTPEVVAPLLERGAELYREPPGPARESALLREDFFNTSLEDANLVGNIYFANYYKWQGRTRDHFLHDTLAGLSLDNGSAGELRCTHCFVQHLGEAMPFDKIAVRMYRASVYERAVRFSFEYYRVAPDGERRKLGHGEHEALWCAPGGEGNWAPAELPAPLRSALLPAEREPAAPKGSAVAKGGREEHDVIVVGAGIGGLTAGALLAKEGRKVLVLEQHNKPGGFCTSFVRKVKHKGEKLRFVFEAGVHDIAAFGEYSSTLRALRELNIQDRIEWRRVEHEYFISGHRMKVPPRLEEYVQVLSGHFPEDRAGLAAFFQEVETCFREIYGMDWKLQDKGKLNIDKWKNIPLSSMLDRYVHDKSLKRLLSVLAYYITDAPDKVGALTAIPYFGYYIEGGRYPTGGTQVLSDELASSIKKNGGNVLLRTAVSRILTENGAVRGVRTRDGDIFNAEAVISNADARRTLLELVSGEDLPQHYVKRIETLKPANSAFLVSLGIDFVPDVNPATFVVDEDVVLGVMIPSKVDSALAPPGCACVTLVKLLPYEEAVSWDRADPNYATRKQKFGDKLVGIAERAIPGLREGIIYRQDASPATFARYAWTTAGSIYGLDIEEWRPAKKTPVRGLFLAGANTAIRPGVEDAVHSALSAADMVHELLSAERSTDQHL